MGWQLDRLFADETEEAAVKPAAPLDDLPEATPTKKTEPQRLRDIPRWTYTHEDLTPSLRTPKGEMTLFPLQNKALIAAREAGGGVLLLGCGVGKTLISLLLSSVMQRDRVLLLVPASLVKKTKAEAKVYRKHFNFAMPTIMSYEKLSRTSGLKALDDLSPSLIICDEAHHLKSYDSTRTRRLGRYIADNLSTVSLVVMSGTLYNKTIADFAHLSEWALRENSPVPMTPRDVDVLDNLLSGQAQAWEWGYMKPFLDAFGRRVDECVYTRLEQTCGVVLTTDDAVPCSLRIVKREADIPEELLEAIDGVLMGETPMTEMLEGLSVEYDAAAIMASDHLWDNLDAMVLRGLSQLFCGMLYFWRWENNEPNYEWLDARKAWRRCVRAIKEMEIPDFDAAELIYKNYEDLPDGLANEWREVYDTWNAHKSFREPPRDAVWVSDYLVEDIKEWTSAQRSHYIVWVDSIVLGERLANELNIPYYGGGTEPYTARSHNCIMSVAAHSTGKNLQEWHNNLVVAGIASPQTWEQLLARTHRTGQQADEVTVTVYTQGFFGRTFKSALRQAKIVGTTTGQPQRIVYADKL